MKVFGNGLTKKQIYLGDDNFVDEMHCKILPGTNLSEVPSSQKRQVAKPLTYYEKEYKDRNTAISKTYRSGSYSLKEIGDYYNLHYSWVSRIVKAKNKT
jgi:putative transposase